MSTIHRTTLTPGKLELLTDWLPRRPWYRGAPTPTLARGGGFRLDDPAGEVGIELAIVTDADGVRYLTPMTYRGAPLEGADDGLIGTSEHGVLGRRWFYDAAHDPVFVVQVLALLRGETVAQHQSVSDTVDPSVIVSAPLAAAASPLEPLAVTDDADGTTIALRDGDPAQAERPAHGLALYLHRRLDDGTGASGVAPLAAVTVEVPDLGRRTVLAVR